MNETHLQKENLEKFYKYQTNFTRSQHLARIKLFSKIFSKYNFDKDIKILDAECGIGAYTIILKKMGYKNVLSVDISKYSLLQLARWAKIENVAVNIHVANICVLPFSNDTFDFILCSENLEHLNDSENGVLELVRVLKYDGYLFVTVPNMLSAHWLPRGVYHKFVTRNKESLAHTKFTLWRILSKFRKHPLEHIKTYGCGSFLPPPFSNTLFFIFKKVLAEVEK